MTNRQFLRLAFTAIATGMGVWVGFWGWQYLSYSQNTDSAIHEVAAMTGLGMGTILLCLAALPWLIANDER